MKVCDGTTEISTGHGYEGFNYGRGEGDALGLSDVLEAGEGGSVVQRFEAEFGTTGSEGFDNSTTYPRLMSDHIERAV